MKKTILLPETVTIIRKTDIERLEQICHEKAEAGMKSDCADAVILFKQTVKLVLKTLGIEDAKSLYDPENEAKRKDKRKERETWIKELTE